jgi:Esterase/lipase
MEVRHQKDSLTTSVGVKNSEFKKPVLQTDTQRFLDKLAAQGSKPIYELSYEEARKVLEGLQAGEISKPAVDIEDRVLPVGPGKEVSIRIFRPEGDKSLLPVVMYFHGGGWILGSKNTHDRLLCELTAKSGAAFVFVNYTPSPEAQFPTAIEEAFAVTEYIASFGHEMNLDAHRLAVAGDSAGGNMATAVCLLAKDQGYPNISYQALLYPVTDASLNTESHRQFANGYWLSTAAMGWFWDAYCPDRKDRERVIVSPLKATVNQLMHLPPTLVITAEADVLRDEGQAYARKLLEAHIDVTAVCYQGTIHDFMMLNALADTPAAKSATSLTAEKLKQALARAPLH